MELILIENIKDEEWDNLIGNYGTKSLFHQSVWLKFLEETQPVKILKFKICENNRIIGYFIGMLEKRGPFKIFSSPRPGCNTPHMGPIVNKNFNQQNFLDVLDKYCKSQKIDHIEIASRYLEPEIMKNYNFKCQEGITYMVKLSPNEDIMWKNLKKKSCRYSIHKAEKNGLIVEDTNNSEIIDEYYEQLKEVFGKQKLIPTYPKERVRFLFNCLKNKNYLFSLWVKYENKIIATGFFPHDNKTVYFFGGASWLQYQYLRPNDLLHWTLMKLAAEKRLKYYDMGGAGSFKPKFGGKLTTAYRYYKSYNPLAGLARTLYQYKFKILQKIKGLKHGKYRK